MPVRLIVRTFGELWMPVGALIVLSWHVRLPRAGPLLTLTASGPEWGSSQRLIAWAHPDATQPVTEGKPAAFHS